MYIMYMHMHMHMHMYQHVHVHAVHVHPPNLGRRAPWKRDVCERSVDCATSRCNRTDLDGGSVCLCVDRGGTVPTVVYACAAWPFHGRPVSVRVALRQSACASVQRRASECPECVCGSTELWNSRI